MCSNKDIMDSRYHLPANVPNHYDQLLSNNNLNTMNNGNRSNSISSRYFHQVPPIFPPHHQQRLRNSSPLFSSSYLGPLQQHRPRFLSTWDLTPTSTIYLSSRNIAEATLTTASVSRQHDEGSCILNSCAVYFFF